MWHAHMKTLDCKDFILTLYTVFVDKSFIRGPGSTLNAAILFVSLIIMITVTNFKAPY